MPQAIVPARDLAEAKVRILGMLQEAQDARWTDEFEEGDTGGYRILQAAVLGEVAAILGASQEEIAAQNRHGFCPSHHAHACDGCRFACAHCWKDYPAWKEST